MLYRLSYASTGSRRSRGKIGAGRGTVKAATSGDASSTSEKAAEGEIGGGVGLFRPSWLPLPERAVNDRVKLHVPPGFVDRAYLVFCFYTSVTTPLLSIHFRPISSVVLTPFRYMGTSKSAPDEVRAPNARAPHLSLEHVVHRGTSGGSPGRRWRCMPDVSTARDPAHPND